MKAAAETSHVIVQTEVGELLTASSSAREVGHATVQTDAQNVAFATEVVHETIQTVTAAPEVCHVAIQTVTVAPEVGHVTVQTEPNEAEAGHLTVAAPEVGDVAVQTEAAGGGDTAEAGQPEVGYVPERLFRDYVAETDHKLTSIIKQLGKICYNILPVHKLELKTVPVRKPDTVRYGNHKAALGKAMFRIVFVTWNIFSVTLS
jgi:hypothetical protein